LQQSPSVDEPVHLLSGYSYLKWGDFRANPEHPPLAKVLAALPLLAFDVRDPRASTPDWDRIPDNKPGPATRNVARKMFFVDNDADRLFFYAKLPMIGLGMILGVFVFLWAKDLYGPTAAAAALFLYCLDPNVLANSQSVHTGG
jgi:predicted membrane-bound dolichyl-phosphate-mannose-protein mannosyltransferase